MKQLELDIDIRVHKLTIETDGPTCIDASTPGEIKITTVKSREERLAYRREQAIIFCAVLLGSAVVSIIFHLLGS